MEVAARGSETERRAALASRWVKEALGLVANGTRTIAIVVNRVDTARQAWRLLSEDHAREADAVLLTGRMRPLDRDKILEDGALDAATPGRDRDPLARAVVVVATKCIEAGADLDFDALVTECASLDALRQRFGRLDRRGDLRETRAVIVACAEQVGDGADDAVYGPSLART